MFEYQAHRQRSADLIRRAEQERLARQLIRTRRAARRTAAEHSGHAERAETTETTAEPEPEARTTRPHRATPFRAT
ncbi:hypothetical protein [Streptomyces sp. MAA16]|uniref:hypothetical protein n=1 Tax=Streptomyces sp. MAA16 TaxID=3035116 RepID=UPI002473CE4C|nr:hypothetical protein [Streptomyces sp. MAA16]MDH6700328.1 septal ring factor EnvC (AmiA/AmiB activator) [Streptomyces sp. MAA16]